MSIFNFFRTRPKKVRSETINLFTQFREKRGDFATSEIFTIFELISSRLQNADFQSEKEFISSNEIINFVTENRKGILLNLFNNGYIIFNAVDLTVREDYYKREGVGIVEIDLGENEILVTSETFRISGRSDRQILISKLEYLNSLSNSDWSLVENYGAMGIISPDGKGVTGDSSTFNPAERKEIQDDYQNNYGLKFGKWKMIISKSALRYQKIDLPIKDLELVTKRKQAILDICAYLNFPKELHPYFENSKYKNLEEAEIQCYTNCIQNNAETLLQVIVDLYNFRKKNTERFLLDNEFWFDFNNVYSLENAKHTQILRIREEYEFWQSLRETEPQHAKLIQERIDNLIENL